MKALIWICMFILFIPVGILMFGIIGILSPGFVCIVIEWILVSRILCNTWDRKKIVGDDDSETPKELSPKQSVIVSELDAELKADKQKAGIWLLSALIMYSIVGIVWWATLKPYYIRPSGLRIDNWLCTVIWAPITALICRSSVNNIAVPTARRKIADNSKPIADSDTPTGNNTPRITYANLSKEELLEAANRVYCSPYKLIVKEIPDSVLSTCYLRRENKYDLREYLTSCVNNGTIPQTYADILFDRYTNGLNVGNSPKVVHNYAYANESKEELTEIAKQKNCTPYKLIEKEIPDTIMNQCYLKRVNKSELQEYLASCVKNGSIPQTYADIILDRFS